MQVNEIMTANPACCTPDSSLREIAQMMVEHDCGLIPVVENQQTKKPIGTVTDRDITIRAFTTGRNPLELKASDVMTMGITTISPETSIQECADVMEDKKIRRVIVVDDNGRCRGIVAQADIAEFGPTSDLLSSVVHEISEADASPNKLSFRRTKNNKSFSNKSFSTNRSDTINRSYQTGDQSYQKKNSLFSIQSLLPILVGIGISAGAKYYLDSNNENRRRLLVSQQSEGVSGDLHASINKSSSPPLNRAEGLKTETDKSPVLNVAFSDKTDDSGYDTKISRTAGQS
jgi:CBS domain-containing protein